MFPLLKWQSCPKLYTLDKSVYIEVELRSDSELTGEIWVSFVSCLDKKWPRDVERVLYLILFILWTQGQFRKKFMCYCSKVLLDAYFHSCDLTWSQCCTCHDKQLSGHELYKIATWFDMRTMLIFTFVLQAQTAKWIEPVICRTSRLCLLFRFNLRNKRLFCKKCIIGMNISFNLRQHIYTFEWIL